MKGSYHYPDDIAVFKEKALQWATSQEVACYFDSNGYKDGYTSFDVLIAAGLNAEVKGAGGSQMLEKLKGFLQEHSGWLPGFLAYDLKNELEELHSDRQDHLGFDDLFFFVPSHILIIRGQQVEILSAIPGLVSQIEAGIAAQPVPPSLKKPVKKRFRRSEYVGTVNRIKDHIARGDIYELNFCQEFYSEDAVIDPLSTFKMLNNLSAAPFSVFFKYHSKFIISASPERFLCRRGNKIISQPIKGTARRSDDLQEDLRLKEELRNNPKEQSENVMIVDLVRNDLTRCALPGTVRVEELFGIYSFRQVHQMISTVACEVSEDTDNTEIISCAFPMGSMTGAPKVRAMELIEEFERTRRGIFSGAVGYFTPEGDFDMNVVIRTLLYDSESGYLSFQTGSAITFASDPEKEYEECLLKAKAILETLGTSFEEEDEN